jgi:hypothetical protein
MMIHHCERGHACKPADMYDTHHQNAEVQKASYHEGEPESDVRPVKGLVEARTNGTQREDDHDGERRIGLFPGQPHLRNSPSRHAPPRPT